MTEDDSFIDLSKGGNSLGEIEAQLGKLLKDQIFINKKTYELRYIKNKNRKGVVRIIR